MIFTLNAYNDLGRCSYGTLREAFDTDNEKIYDNNVEVKIEKIEDLFPYLWQSPGIACHMDGCSAAYFHGSGTHWHRDFDESLKNCEKDFIKVNKRLEKATDEKKRAKYAEQLRYINEHTERLKSLISYLDMRMEEQKLKLIEENKNV